LRVAFDIFLVIGILIFDMVVLRFVAVVAAARTSQAAA
jgi:hypothetical protein